MSDAAYCNATARREQLSSEIAELKQKLEAAQIELSRVSAFIRQWEEFAGVEPSATGAVGIQYAQIPGLEVLRRPKPKNPRKEDVAEAARAIIAEYGRPMMRAELFNELAKRGLEIKGSDPEMVLSTMLWRMPSRIVRLPKGGYWLTDKPHALSGYEPPNVFS